MHPQLSARDIETNLARMSLERASYNSEFLMNTFIAPSAKLG
jgi:hypothetical protein